MSLMYASTPIRVFISSTVEEFRDLRSALAYVLKSQGLTVYLSEATNFDLRGDRSAFDECFTNISNADVYVLIIGNNRGSIYKDDISITRKEYRVALEQFLSTGRPKLLFYLRDFTEMALKNIPESQLTTGIDVAGHLSSFIDEVQQPGIEAAPNYLVRFQDSEELIKSVAHQLNLGRNLSETLVRFSLKSELLHNLSLMFERSGTTVRPHHSFMSKIRDEITITPQEVGKFIELSHNQIANLLRVLIGRAIGSDLRTEVIEQSLEDGVFLEFDVTTGYLKETPAHKALRETFEDINSLCKLDNPYNNREPNYWDRNILDIVKDNRGSHPLSINATDLALAFAYYDNIENIYNSHISLVKFLSGLTDQLPHYERRLVSPLGDQMAKDVRGERVSVPELNLLFNNNVWPIGDRIPREKYGTTTEEQVQNIAAMFKSKLTERGINTDEYSEDINKYAETFLKENTALPDECIGNIHST